MINSPKDRPGKIDRIIDYLKTLGKKSKARIPDREAADYSAWNQTEAEYQQEQAAWLEKVKQKQKKRSKDAP